MLFDWVIHEFEDGGWVRCCWGGVLGYDVDDLGMIGEIARVLGYSSRCEVEVIDGEEAFWIYCDDCDGFYFLAMLIYSSDLMWVVMMGQELDWGSRSVNHMACLNIFPTLHIQCCYESWEVDGSTGDAVVVDTVYLSRKTM